MRIEHRGFSAFRNGNFCNAGANLFVDATGAVRRIIENDVNNDGYFDIVFPNTHGYVERGPTTIYSQDTSGKWLGRDLPHDACWKTKIADVDGDGYDDLIVVNAENGVSSVLTSYVYYGGPNGLTGERSEFATEGAYDVVCADLTGNGFYDLIFTSAWADHHMYDYSFKQKVYLQESPRVFKDATDEFNFLGQSVVALLYEDLNNDGYPEFVMAGYKGQFTEAGIGYIYSGGPMGLAKEPITLPTYLAMGVHAVDLNHDGFKELIFFGGNQLMIYWNNDGVFSENNVEFIDLEGYRTQFFGGRIAIDSADVDGDGLIELIIGYGNGFEIRRENNLHTIWQKVEGFHCFCVKAVDFNGSNRMTEPVRYFV